MAEHILIVGVNWLGDSVMSMPAIQRLKQTIPNGRVTLLVRPELAPLWRLHPATDRVWPTPRGLRYLPAIVRRVRAERFDRAVIFPNSFRSALVPFCAQVPMRVGARGHMRSWMLTHIAPPPPLSLRHQAWEYVFLLHPTDLSLPLPHPELRLTAEDIEQQRTRWVPDRRHPVVALFPGAARGPAKQWPAERFTKVGRQLATEIHARILVFGTASEAPLCAAIVEKIGSYACSLAGRVALQDLPAAVKIADVAISNDNGGMHVAAAVGVPVVAIFGLTDPERTGPLGAGHRVVTLPHVPRARDIERHSAAARACLRAIPHEEVYAAARDILERSVSSRP